MGPSEGVQGWHNQVPREVGGKLMMITAIIQNRCRFGERIKGNFTIKSVIGEGVTFKFKLK